QLRQQRLAGGVEQGQQVLALVAPGLGRGRRGGDLRLAQAGQFGHVVDQHRRVVDFVEHVVGKLRAQFGQARVDLLEPRLLRGIEPGAGAHEIVVVLLDQAQALGVEAEAGALAVDGLDAREQPRIEHDRVAVRGELRRVLVVDLLADVVGVGAVEVAEDAARIRQQLAGLLQRDDRVLERRLRLLADDRLDLLQFLRHAGVERGREVFVPDPVELREAQRQRALHEQRVGGLGIGGGRGVHEGGSCGGGPGVGLGGNGGGQGDGQGRGERVLHRWILGKLENPRVAHGRPPPCHDERHMAFTRPAGARLRAGRVCRPSRRRGNGGAMTRNSWMALGLMLAMAGGAQAAQTLRYVALVDGGKQAGRQTVVEGEDGITRTTFIFKDNGRGPELEEEFSLNPDGTFRSYRVTGTSTFGAPVDERFELVDGLARWKSTSDQGEQRVAEGAQYSPLGGTPAVVSVALATLAARDDGRLPLIPSGTLSVRKVADAQVRRGDEARTVQLLAITGIGFTPTFVWATDQARPRLFAYIYPGFLQLVEDGWEANADALEEAQKAAEAEALVS